MEFVDRLAAKWRREAARWRSLGADLHGEIYVAIAAELEQAAEAYLNEPLTIARAAAECGYSEPQLRRLVAEGAVQNAASEPHRVAIARRQLPRKPGSHDN